MLACEPRPNADKTFDTNAVRLKFGATGALTADANGIAAAVAANGVVVNAVCVVVTATDAGVPKSTLGGALRVSFGVDGGWSVGVSWFNDSVDSTCLPAGGLESCWFPKVVDDELSCGAKSEPKKANGLSGRDVELEDDGLDGVLVDVAEEVDGLDDDAEVPAVSEFEDVFSVVAVPELGDDAVEFDD